MHRWITAVLVFAVSAGCGGRSGPRPLAPGGDASSASPPGQADAGPRPDAPVTPDLPRRKDSAAPPPDAPARAPGEWAYIAPGRFFMGSREKERCRLDNETRHAVRLTRGFFMSATEVTQGQYTALIGQNPSKFSSCGRDCPVESVTWHDAAVYCNLLSRKRGLARCYSCEGDGVNYTKPYNCKVNVDYERGSGKTILDCRGYRLPTEAEWEYAYRAATTTALYNGAIRSCFVDPRANKISWYFSNSRKTPQKVEARKPNRWGLHDMAGNVWEWTHDWYRKDLGSDAVTDPLGPPEGKGRVMRGGSWTSSAGSVRAAGRNKSRPIHAMSSLGFRCVRTAF